MWGGVGGSIEQVVVGARLSTIWGSLLRRLWGFMLVVLGLALTVINHCAVRTPQPIAALQEPLKETNRTLVC